MAAFIDLSNVSVRYPVDLSQGQARTLGRQAGAPGPVAKSDRRVVHVPALSQVSFKLEPGDRLGLIGRNGSGKTTLLKVLAGLLPPSSGVLEREGSVRSILSLGAGADPNLSGIENIRLMCMLMRVPRRQWNAVIEDVTDFADLGAFIALPMRTYSLGMSMRLHFGVATATPCDMLVLDEVVGVGDGAFMTRAHQRLDRLAESLKVMVLATHDYGLLMRFCNRALFVKEGRIAGDGAPASMWTLYHEVYAREDAAQAQKPDLRAIDGGGTADEERQEQAAPRRRRKA